VEHSSEHSQYNSPVGLVTLGKKIFSQERSCRFLQCGQTGVKKNLCSSPKRSLLEPLPDGELVLPVYHLSPPCRALVIHSHPCNASQYPPTMLVGGIGTIGTILTGEGKSGIKGREYLSPHLHTIRRHSGWRRDVFHFGFACVGFTPLQPGL